MASGGYKTITIWDVETGRQLAKATPHERHVFAVAFSPDGKTLAPASYDRTVRLSDAATLAEGAVLRGHLDQVFSVTFSPNGKILASSGGKTVRLWDPETGRQKAVLQGHTSWVRSVAFSPDGKTLASAGRDRKIKIWAVNAAWKSSPSDSPAAASQRTPIARKKETSAVAFGVGLSSSPKAKAAAIEAAKEAAAALGDRKAKAVIVFHGKDFASDYAKVLDGVASVFDQSIVYGCSGYAPLGHQSHEGTVGVLAIGGGVEVTVAVAGTSGEGDDIECGQRIGRALKKAAQSNATGKLLLLFGDCHVPRTNDLVKGVAGVLGNKFPIIGGAAFEGTIYVKGKRLKNSNLGLLLTGDFHCGLSLKRDNSNAGLATSAHDAVKEAIGSSKEKTSLVFVFDCVGRQRKMLRNGNFPAELAAMKEAAGEIPLFGFYCNGEIGHKDNGTAPRGVANHISTCAISTK